MSNEKQKVALSSVLAAILLTSIKIVIGVITGSLGVLSEAAHSSLDLIAAFITFLAVKMSDKPADRDHNYGHGKIESFSALFETLLLFITCGWIVYEAVGRLFLGRPMEVSDTPWAIGALVISIIIDLSRSRALKNAAKKYGSQALEADALHFSSDVWSSCVVIVGLACVWIGDMFNINALKYGDPIAALGVSVLVVIVSIRLGKRTVDVLLDTAPEGMIDTVLHEVNSVDGVLEADNVRVRASGPNYFIEVNVGICKSESHRVVHAIVDEIRGRLKQKIPNSDIVISTYPISVADAYDTEEYHAVKSVVDKFPACTNIHNIHVYEVGGQKYIAIHLEVKESMNLNESHALSHKIGAMVQESMKDVKDVSVNFEYVKQNYITAEDITDKSQKLIESIGKLVNKVPDKLNCHDIKVYTQQGKKTIFLHCELNGNFSIEKIEKISKNISNKIRKNIGNIESIHVHVEPM